MEGTESTRTKKSWWPGFKILDRYILGKFIGTYVAAIAFLTVVIVIFDMAEKMDDFIEYRASFFNIIFGYYLNFVPFLVNQFSGLFTFISVIFFTSKMAFNTEIIAILSNGVSFNRLLWPYFISALLIACTSMALSFYIIPRASERQFAFESQYTRKGRNAQFQYDRDIYRQVAPGTFAYVRGFSKELNEAQYFVIETYENNRIVASLTAARATYNETTGRWTSNKYIERRFIDGCEEFLQKQNLDTAINLTITELGKTSNLVKTLNINELNQFIKQQKDKGSDMVSAFQIEFYSRIAYPLSAFILTLIGLSLSSRKVRGGIGMQIGVGVGLCFTYIMMMKIAEEFAKSNTMPSWLAVWLPNIIFGVIAVYLYRKARR